MHGMIVNGCYIKHEREKDILKMGGGSWTINLIELGDQDYNSFKYITEKATYTITRFEYL